MNEPIETLVTIKDFIDNGGQMYKGEARRQIYYHNGIQFDCQIKSLYDAIIDKESAFYYVKILCTPHYI